MFIWNDRAGRSLTVAFGLLSAILLLFGRSDVARAAVGGQCAVNTVAYRASTAAFSTTSTSAVIITGMGMQFVQGGTSPSCVAVQFTAYGSTQATNASYITFELDGNQQGDRLFVDRLATGRLDLTTIVSVFPGVAPGTHTLRVRLSSSDGAQVDVTAPTLLLQYRK